jgi:flavorubredoxin
MSTYHPPFSIAPDTFVVHAALGEGTAPVAVHVNAMVIRGAQPVVVDTGAPVSREQYLRDVFSIVEPDDVRWIFISHEDVDHVGNLASLIEACPNATIVGSWFLMERMGAEGLCAPPTRWRWIGDGESFDAGDRTLHAIRPPLYDSPTTRGLFDPSTGVYWASDCFAAPVMQPSVTVEELDPGFWAEGFAMFQVYNSPWVSLLDPTRYAAEVDRFARLGVRTIATCHSPSITEAYVDKAIQMLRDVPGANVPPQPGQPVLDQIIASMMQ